MVDLPLGTIDVQALRKQPKKLRFCPSCGTRRLRAKALHTVCLACGFEFVMAPIDDIKNVRISGESAGVTTFDVTVGREVDGSREDVQKLTKSIRFDDEESDRMDDLGEEDEVRDRLYGI
jgi:hypothetical protein